MIQHDQISNDTYDDENDNYYNYDDQYDNDDYVRDYEYDSSTRRGWWKQQNFVSINY